MSCWSHWLYNIPRSHNRPTAIAPALIPRVPRPTYTSRASYTQRILHTGTRSLFTFAVWVRWHPRSRRSRRDIYFPLLGKNKPGRTFKNAPRCPKCSTTPHRHQLGVPPTLNRGYAVSIKRKEGSLGRIRGQCAPKGVLYRSSLSGVRTPSGSSNPVSRWIVIYRSHD